MLSSDDKQINNVQKHIKLKMDGWGTLKLTIKDRYILQTNITRSRKT